jgi:hypothetical protein
MGRTLRSGERDWGLWLLLLVAAAMCHMSWQLTARIGFDLRSIAFLIAIYAGYKFGRWPGAALGLLSTLGLLVWAWLGVEPPSLEQAVLGPLTLSPLGADEAFALRGLSLQDALMAAGIGFIGGWAFDRAEQFLQRPLSSLLTATPEVGPLRRAYDGIGRLLWTDPNVAKRIGAPTWQMLLTPVVLLLLPLLNFTMLVRLEPWTLRVFPPLLAAVVVGMIAWRSGFGRAAAAALWSVASSWMVYAALEGMEDLQIPGSEISPSIQGPEQVLGLLVVAWWLAQASATLNDGDQRDYWRGIWSRMARAKHALHRPSVTLWMALLPLAIGFAISIGPLQLAYVPILGLFLALAGLARRYGGVAVSRQAFWVLLVLSVAGVGFDPVRHLWLDTLSPSAVDLVLLAAVPLVAAQLDLSRICVSRMLCFGILAAWTLTYALIGGSVPDGLLSMVYEDTSDAGMVAVRGVQRLPLPLLSWLVTLLAVEAGARLLTRVAPPGKSSGAG